MMAPKGRRSPFGSHSRADLRKQSEPGCTMEAYRDNTNGISPMCSRVCIIWMKETSHKSPTLLLRRRTPPLGGCVGWR